MHKIIPSVSRRVSSQTSARIQARSVSVTVHFLLDTHRGMVTESHRFSFQFSLNLDYFAIPNTLSVFSHHFFNLYFQQEFQPPKEI